MNGDHQAALGEASRRESTTRRSNRKALLILGMHRSGTSLLAYLLHILGAALPVDVIGPARGNPLGHWEPRNLVAINDDTLRALDRSWDDPRPIDQEWFLSRAAYSFVDRIIVQISRDYGDAELLLIKDPRICRLLPLYLTALDVLDIEALVILQLRPFPEVGRSLWDRDAFEPDLSELLWLRSIIEAERNSRNRCRVWVTLDQLLADWQATTCRIAATLGFEWNELSEEAAAQAACYVKPHLCRSAHAPNDRMDAAHWLARQTWSAALHGLGGDEAAAQASFDELWMALQDLDRMFASCLPRLIRPHETMVDAIYRSTSWRVTAPLRALKPLMLWTAERGASADRRRPGH
jgi:hypothetical protein